MTDRKRILVVRAIKTHLETLTPGYRRGDTTHERDEYYALLKQYQRRTSNSEKGVTA